MEVKRLRILGLEVFKALNSLNPAFMGEIFHRTKWLTHRTNNIRVNVHKTFEMHGIRVEYQASHLKGKFCRETFHRKPCIT